MTHNTQRRTVLKGTAATAALGFSGVLSTLLSSAAQADYASAAFESESMDEALKALFESTDREDSDKVILDAPDIAENGAVVPIKVKADMSGVSRMAILVENNPSPLAAAFNLGEGAKADASTRIKMGKTSNVIALVEADGKVFAASKEVKVTIGGCGG